MACEKCWGDAYFRYVTDPSKSQAEHYHDLLEERKDNPCTPEQQLGQFAEVTPAPALAHSVFLSHGAPPMCTPVPANTTTLDSGGVQDHEGKAEIVGGNTTPVPADADALKVARKWRKSIKTKLRVAEREKERKL